MTDLLIGDIVMIFLAFRDQLKIYHWQTHSYSKHKASDRLVNNITEKMDQFVETIQGSRNTRLRFSRDNKMEYNNQTDDSIVFLMRNFREWLTYSLPNMLDSKDVDLLNLRDEILSLVNNTLYLFTLS